MQAMGPRCTGRVWLPPCQTLPVFPVLWHSCAMGNKDKGRKEAKKAPKPKPKPELGRRAELFAAPPAK